MDHKSIVIKFDIANTQNDYAACMAFLAMVEEGKDAQFFPQIENTPMFMFKVLDDDENGLLLNNPSMLWKKESKKLLTLMEEGDGGNSFSLFSRAEQFKKYIQEYQRYYFIRVRMGEEDVIDLQYLVLLLQWFHSILADRMLVYFPETDQYHKCSHYLRFVSRKYCPMLGRFHSENQGVVVRRLTDKVPGKQSTFFPVLEINEEMYGQTTPMLSTFRDKAEEDCEQPIRQLWEIAERIMQDRLSKSDLKGSSVFFEEARKYLGIIGYAVLCSIVEGRYITNTSKWQEYRRLASRIEDGLRQIIENVVHHSESKKGVFSFRRHKDSVHIRKLHAMEPPRNLEKEAFIQIFVSDINRSQTMFDRFACLYEKEAEQVGLSPECIAVSEFFGEYMRNDNINKWNHFRINNREKCRGLRMLAANLAQLKGMLWVKTSTDYNTPKERFVYSKNFRGESDPSPLTNAPEGLMAGEIADFRGGDGSSLVTGRQMPGTQLSIVYSLTDIEDRTIKRPLPAHNSEQEIQRVGYRDGDSSYFSKCIDYEAVSIWNNPAAELLAEFDNNAGSTDGQKRKLDMIYGCADKLAAKMSEVQSTQVAYINLKQLGGEDHRVWEIFSKGLLLSMLKVDREFQLALVHVTERDIDRIIRFLLLADQITQEEPTLLSHCAQLYIYGEGKETLLMGSSEPEMIFNAEQYGFIRGYVPQEIAALAENLSSRNFKTSGKLIDAVPFDVIVPVEQGGKQTIFDDYINYVTDKDITSQGEAGYMLSKTHMRLGSKVHLEDFYEASLLFQKPRIAKRMALQILRHLKRDKIDLDLGKDPFVFYGYASYSRLILGMLVEILGAMRGGSTENIEFVVYQNDLANSSKDADIKLYFSNDEGNATARYRLPDGAKVLQIVPISTTLSTFKKMWSKFLNEVDLGKGGNTTCGSDDTPCPYANYALFWVRDKEGKDGQPTEIEERYWKHVDAVNRTITTQMISPNPVVFVSKRIKWHSPESCLLCYSKDLLGEFPLIETDPTSTVPTVQFDNVPIDEKKLSPEREREKQRRLMKLRGCILGGHIKRGNNHFQYYLDTGRLFLTVREDLKVWLQNKRKEATAEELKNWREHKKEGMPPVMHVIVTPANQSNVEFFQYVHRYYFGETANVINLDSRREYRSNFEAKYADVKRAVADAYKRGYTVKWHFVDDTIISGATFWRSNSLIQSLYQGDKQKSIIFDTIFLLINRLSARSKLTYSSAPEKHFHSHIDIYLSSMRSSEDLCVGCNLQKMTERLQKRSATQHICQALMKASIRYQPVPFDKWDYQWGDDCDGYGSAEKNRDKAYFRLICSHLARLWVEVIPVEKLMEPNEKPNTVRAVLHLLQLVIGCVDQSGLKAMKQGVLPLQGTMIKKEGYIAEEVLEELRKNKKLAVESYIKILTRPFFSFKKKLKNSGLDLSLIVADSILDVSFNSNEESIKPYFADKFKGLPKDKEYLNDESIITALTELMIYLKGTYHGGEMLLFLVNFVFESLCDLRSNYIIRKQTLNNVRAFLEKYWKISGEDINEKRKKITEFLDTYAILIQRLVNNSSDESKSMWLDDLLIFGQEGAGKGPPVTELKDLMLEELDWECADDNVWVRMQFNFFLYDVFFENSRVYYEGVRDLAGHLSRVAPETLSDPEGKKSRNNVLKKTLGQTTENYFLDNFVRLAEMSFPGNSPGKATSDEGAKIVWGSLDLYQLLKNKKTDHTEIQTRNTQLPYTRLQLYLNDISKAQVAILTLFKDQFFNVANPGAGVTSNTKTQIKTAQERLLEKKGYYIGSDFILIKLDNQFEAIDTEFKDSRIFNHTLVGILPVYLHLSSLHDNNLLDKLHSTRRILAYRNMLIRWIEKDFNNTAIPDLCAREWIARRLFREKALDHTSRSDLSAVRKLLQVPSDTSTGDESDYARLAFFKLYVNQMIARIYMTHVKYGDNGYPGREASGGWTGRYCPCGKNEDNDMFNKKLKKLGEAFFGKTDDEFSRASYFELLDKYFTIKWNDGQTTEWFSLLELRERLDKWDCLCSEDWAYKSEEMTCLILDIFFSAMRKAPEWHCNGGAIPENDLLDQFRWYDEYKKKVVIQVQVEPAGTSIFDRNIMYLVFRNKTYLENKNDIDKLNLSMTKLDRMDHDGQGISLLTMQWYIEGIEKILRTKTTFGQTSARDKSQRLNVRYYYEREEQDVYFVQKLPILMEP